PAWTINPVPLLTGRTYGVAVFDTGSHNTGRINDPFVDSAEINTLSGISSTLGDDVDTNALYGFDRIQGLKTAPGVVTLNAKPLDEVCNSVYILDDGGSDTIFQASLNGGSTWQTVPSGELTVLNHIGSSLVIRATI